MNDSALVSVIQRLGDLRSIPGHGFCRQARWLGQGAQDAPLQILHNDIGPVINLAYFMDGADMGMVQPRCRAGLMEQSRLLRFFTQEMLAK
jgi:hypothetical protein